MTYDEWLLKVKPRPIRNEREHAKALRQVDEIMRIGPHLPKEASQIVEVLSTLIEDYEAKEFPTPDLSPAALLAQLIDTRGLTKAEVASATGIPRSTITNVIAGRRQLSLQNIRRLSTYFAVPAGRFLSGATGEYERQS